MKVLLDTNIFLYLQCSVAQDRILIRKKFKLFFMTYLQRKLKKYRELSNSGFNCLDFFLSNFCSWANKEGVSSSFVQSILVY